MKVLNKAVCGMFLFVACQNQTTWHEQAVKHAESQLLSAAKYYKPGSSPRSLEKDGSVRLSTRHQSDPDWPGLQDWTSGFFPGSLWYLYELTGNEEVKKEAINYTEALDGIQYYTHTHDLGFMINCSFGNAYRLTKNPKYKELMRQGAVSLSNRFNPQVACLRSWDFGPWQFPVIVDNMMNLELLNEVAVLSGNQVFKDISIAHANTTMQHHFRDDYSSYHVLDYDTISGKPLSKGTFQGYADHSAWARGQAWGLYGYTMMFRYTKDKKYLEMAEHIASFIMSYKQMPADLIPYWDYDAPNIPNAPRDASAAAITASALLELCHYAENGEAYFDYAENILKSLASPSYQAELGENALFVLKHSVGAYPNNSEVDCPLNYADYYYLEALLRYKKKLNY